LYLWSWTHTASGSEKSYGYVYMDVAMVFILAVIIIFDLVRGQIAKPLMWAVIIIKFHILINSFYYSTFVGLKHFTSNCHIIMV
jgi:hypothetical protein